MEGHRVLGLDLVDGQPPVELCIGGREPRIPMRMELERETRVHVVAVRHRPQPRHVEVRPLHVAADVVEQFADQLLRARMVDEPRLEVFQDRGILLGGHEVLRDGGVVRSKRLFAQLPCECGEAAGARRRRAHEEVTPVQQTPARVVLMRGVDVDRSHQIPLSPARAGAPRQFLVKGYSGPEGCHYLPATEDTYAATSAICCADRVSLNGGIAPPPFVTCVTTLSYAGMTSSRFGPTLPLEPASASV